MTALETRVLAALGDHRPSGWEGLMTLFQTDREAFYLLSTFNSTVENADVAALTRLASAVRTAVRETYEILPNATDASLMARSGQVTPIPRNVVEQVRAFLRAVDGKTTTTTAGKDFEGEDASEAEMLFKLGNPNTWDEEQKKLEARRNARPWVLQVDAEDLEHLNTQPPYVVYELLHCARKTVLAPTAVFRGLKRGGDTPPSVNDGWAFFGKPRRAYENDGTPVCPPEGKLFVVYADKDGFVFDWDWTPEDPDRSGYPLGPTNDRFEEEVKLDLEVVLNLPANLVPGQFDPKRACYSTRGDCIFCYMTDEKSFAVRINSDLTVFQSVKTNEHTGFKIKNVRRILQVDQSIVISDPPGLVVAVDTVLMAVSRRQHESLEFYAVLIRRLHRNAGQPKVRVPQVPELAAC